MEGRACLAPDIVLRLSDSWDEASSSLRLDHLGEKTFQESLKNAIASSLLCRRPLGTSCSVMVPDCCRTVRIMPEAGTRNLATPRRSRQPLIQMSSM